MGIGMRVLITGASGFIGSYVTRALIDSGHDVLVLAVPDDDLWRLQDVLANVSVVRGTLQDTHNLQVKIHEWKPTACLHLAWYAEPGKYLNSTENLNSLQGSLNLLQILAETGCRQFVGAGTCAEYEMKKEMLAEIDKVKPETLYAASKLSFQMVGEQLAKEFGLHFAWGRIFFLYGEKEDPRRLVPAAVLALQKGEVFPASQGEQVRDYLHIADIANAFLTLVEKQSEGIFNICSSQPLTIRNLLIKIGELTGKPHLISHGALPYREWEPMFICGNNDKLKSLGWVPKISLEQGLQQVIQWWWSQAK